MKPHETINGRILYTSQKPGRDGQERGREFFTITKHTDGRRTLRAHCQIDDPPNVMRDVTLTLDSEWVTREAYVRLSVGDKTLGTTWYRFEDSYAECEGYLHDRGRFSDRVEYEQPSRIFGSHPIQGDAWHLATVDRSRGPSIEILRNFLMTSLDHRGATGPALERWTSDLPVEYVGETRVSVAAGTFDALHFCYGERGSSRPGSNETGEHPPYEIWTTADDDFIFLQARVTGYMMTRYELTHLERLPADT